MTFLAATRCIQHGSLRSRSVAPLLTGTRSQRHLELSSQTQHRPSHVCRSATAFGGQGGQGSDDGSDYSKVADRLNKLMLKPSISAQELRELVYGKWGRTYEVRLCKLRGQMYLQVMWKFLEQQSFHLSEDEYMEQLEAVAHFLNEWGVDDVVRGGIKNANPRGPGYTGGGNARCISIPLDVDLSGSRSGEWN